MFDLQLLETTGRSKPAPSLRMLGGARLMVELLVRIVGSAQESDGAQASLGFLSRLDFWAGANERQPISTGSVTTQGAQVTAIDSWRFEGTAVAAGNRWQVQLHNIRLFGK